MAVLGDNVSLSKDFDKGGEFLRSLCILIIDQSESQVDDVTAFEESKI